MAVTLVFNPLLFALEVCEDLHPDLEAEVCWATQEDPGLTLFPEDGGTPQIMIDVGLPLDATVEVLMHEVAHVVAGVEAGHGSEWEGAFDALHCAYLKKFEGLFDGLSVELVEVG